MSPQSPTQFLSSLYVLNQLPSSSDSLRSEEDKIKSWISNEAAPSLFVPMWVYRTSRTNVLLMSASSFQSTPFSELGIIQKSLEYPYGFNEMKMQSNLWKEKASRVAGISEAGADSYLWCVLLKTVHAAQGSGLCMAGKGTDLFKSQHTLHHTNTWVSSGAVAEPH